MRSYRALVNSLLLTLLAGLSACGGGGGGGSDGGSVSRPVTDSSPSPNPPATHPPPAGQDGPAADPGGTPGKDTPPDQTGGDKPDNEPVPEDDPPPPPPIESICATTIDRCLDLNAASLTRYLGGKRSAASYTFDDGYASSTTIAEIFEQSGWRATFYIVPGTVETLTGWDYWRAIAARGHEIGNHSMTHSIELNDPTLSEQTLMTEIVGAQQLIEQRLGMRPRTIAFPWHMYSARALEIAEKSHLSVRKLAIGESNYEFAFFDLAHDTTPEQALARANAQLTRVVDTDGWLVAGGHGVDGDGWSPVSSQFLRDHLAHAARFSSRLWVDTYEKVARYRACRPLFTPSVFTSAPGKAVVTLTGQHDPRLCTDPLTVAIPVKATLQSGFKASSRSGAAVDAVVVGERLLVSLRPGDEITVEVAPTLARPDTRYR
ncbi:polysaccharide deacetylase family protein [Noviherbaspirillum aridicola]|uniref:NodB homology domain-containing protein n=1 Tax=Noviherbaspirillum aridicola TaxID=2849687 RepID=A0ABQ4PZ55_9BURK|nr:polysaccharide deacetylase family protein [Noviherbaspirillum aridicola]GIZ50096.1 hypothetical protein NCCP691_01100 [Noviherbaspirillum aridicola]